MTLTVVVLTRDEEKHIARAIKSVAHLSVRVTVVDSGSTDDTVKIAHALGAEVLHNPWRNYATQFNWALRQLPHRTEWVMRLDADEVVSPDLLAQIMDTLPHLSQDIDGITVGRRMAFMGRVIRHGGLFPVQVLRVFRHGKGICEDRWMDEHIRVQGRVINLQGEVLDDNLNSLSWWTEKHNGYSSREVIDVLNLEYGFLPYDSIASLREGQAGMKRWIKEKVYARCPGGLRAVGYFFFRYFLRGGFLDGKEGFAFHVLQGFWYRFLVDAKLAEVRRLIEMHGLSPEAALLACTGIDVMAGSERA